MKFTGYLILVVFCGLMLYAASSLPNRGDLSAPSNRDLSLTGTPNAGDYYIRNSYHDTHTPNMVTAILADYRGYDTLGEETVILAAGLICFLLLRRKQK